MSAVSTVLLVLLPAAAALAGLLLRRSRGLAGLVAVGASAGALLLAVVQWASTGDRPAAVATLGPLPTGGLAVPLHLSTDRATAVIAVAVGIVGLAVQVFSIWYLAHDRRYPVFAATVSLFLAGMLLVVQSGDLLLTLVGWEVMGWCSYLLIGHTSTRESARRAAYKAFLVTRVADIGFVLGVVVLAAGAGSTDIGAVLASWGAPRADTASLVTTSPVLTVALVGLVVGVAGKSGLVPFHDWLPDAMEGPTPASALIHAATMVAAGTVVIAHLFPLYAVDATSRTVLAVLAALTMVGAAALAFAQPDVKRMLAYSTLSQVAIMLSALSLGAGANGPAAGLGHLFSHALFKSLLFLAIGWLSVIGGGTAFVALRGRARGRGALLWATGIGLAALAGLPPLVGFFSKESVIAAAEAALRGPESSTAWVVLVALVVTVPLTAAYCTRAWLVLTAPAAGPADEAVALREAEERVGQPESALAAAPAGDDQATAGLEPRPVGGAAAVTVSALAVLTVIGALFLLPLQGALHVGPAMALISLLLVAGAFLGVRAAGRGVGDPVARLGARWREQSERGFGADTAYVAVGRAVLAAARLVVTLDRDVVDAYPRGAVNLTGRAGSAGERAHRGAPGPGIVAVVAGVVALAVAGVTVWR